MAWKCPACETPIEHRRADDLYTVGKIYRCAVCRLELIFDPQTGKMILAPLHEEDEDIGASTKRNRTA
jgi:rubredoxin